MVDRLFVLVVVTSWFGFLFIYFFPFLWMSAWAATDGRYRIDISISRAYLSIVSLSFFSFSSSCSPFTFTWFYSIVHFCQSTYPLLLLFPSIRYRIGAFLGWFIACERHSAVGIPYISLFFLKKKIGRWLGRTSQTWTLASGSCFFLECHGLFLDPLVFLCFICWHGYSWCYGDGNTQVNRWHPTTLRSLVVVSS